MKILPTLFSGLALLIATTGAFAATKPTATPAPAPKTEAKTPAPAAAPAPAVALAPAPAPAPTPAAAPSKFEDYTVELTARIELTDAEKKQVEGIYTDDGPALQKILNDDSLSPLQKSQQVADLREVRNAKIEKLLHDLDRQRAFEEIETIYRVALTECAAEGGLVPAPAPAEKSAAAQATSVTPAAPAAAAPVK